MYGWGTTPTSCRVLGRFYSEPFVALPRFGVTQLQYNAPNKSETAQAPTERVKRKRVKNIEYFEYEEMTDKYVMLVWLLHLTFPLRNNSHLTLAYTASVLSLRLFYVLFN